MLGRNERFFNVGFGRFVRYFTTTCDTPDGDPKLLEMVVQEMNADVGRIPLRTLSLHC